jgi:hypothetical protein
MERLNLPACLADVFLDIDQYDTQFHLYHTSLVDTRQIYSNHVQLIYAQKLIDTLLNPAQCS